MPIDGHLPHKFWAEALSTAVYLRNRNSHKAKGNALGYYAFGHVPKDEMHRLDAKARKCIFLGYGEETKGYRLYDTTKGRVFYSRDVRFNETKQKLPVVPKIDILKLDLLSNSEVSFKNSEEELSPNNTTEPVFRRSGREK